MGRDRPVSSVFTLPGTHNDVFCLPTTVGFRRVLSMHVPRAGHESSVAGDACHALIPDDSGAGLCTSLTSPSWGRSLLLQAFSLSLGKGIFQLHIPPTKGGALNGARQCPPEPSHNAPRPLAGRWHLNLLFINMGHATDAGTPLAQSANTDPGLGKPDIIPDIAQIVWITHGCA
jgi:hypothetical protein